MSFHAGAGTRTSCRSSARRRSYPRCWPTHTPSSAPASADHLQGGLVQRRTLLSMGGLRISLSLLVIAVVAAAAPARAADPPKGSEWTEHYFPSEDGLTMLHADVLRSKGLGETEETPIVLTV